jgi:hypothetical protein
MIVWSWQTGHRRGRRANRITPVRCCLSAPARDGADWIRNLADEQFPGAIPNLDLDHARQHLRDLARRLFPQDETKCKVWIRRFVEAGCKTVISSRLKRSGMFWTVAYANAILALRCSYLNGRFEDYWEGRHTA